jgi:PKD repeat protein
VIESVILSPTSTAPGSAINVTVIVTDNIGVSDVKANDISLLNQGENTWNGSITALEGIHSVNVSALDGAGNIAWDNSTSYTAVTPDNFPPSSISDLQSTNGNTWINWTWTNPTDLDFNHTEIYLNGILQTDTSDGYFNATGLQPETSYTLSTRTVDNNGNVNETWVNSTATTGKVIVPIIPVANFSSNTTEGYAPLDVRFTNLSTDATDFQWNFGDGSENTSVANPEHVFMSTGLFDVVLTASNANGSDSKSMTINVTNFPIFPGCTKPPTDPNNDGIYEDINGNGRIDFKDIVAYYNNMDWITQNGVVAYFDLNHNGRIDFKDVVKLYNMI